MSLGRISLVSSFPYWMEAKRKVLLFQAIFMPQGNRKSCVSNFLIKCKWKSLFFSYFYCLRVTQEDVFSLTAVDLGVLKKLRIRHDNSHASAGWFLDRVEIIDTKDDTTWVIGIIEREHLIAQLLRSELFDLNNWDHTTEKGCSLRIFQLDVIKRP